MNTVALVVFFKDGIPSLVDVLSEDQEIDVVDQAIQAGEEDPLTQIYQRRAEQEKQDEDFGDYVERLLTQPVLQPQVKYHALQWLKSKVKLEKYLRQEKDSARVIAEYAFKLFQLDAQKIDFILVSRTNKVRIKVFQVSGACFIPATKILA